MIDVDENAKIIWDYMLLKHPLKRCEAIFTLCSFDTRVASWAAQLYLEGYGKFLIFSGGMGPSTSHFNKPEAELFADIAVSMGVPREKIIIEDKSANTGENVRFTYKILAEMNLKPTSLLLVQKPYMERRTYATFKKQWPDKPDIVVSSPPIAYEDYFDSENAKERVINVMVGDLQRIKEYPKLGFQIEQEIPDKVWAARENLARADYNKHSISV